MNKLEQEIFVSSLKQGLIYVLIVFVVAAILIVFLSRKAKTKEDALPNPQRDLRAFEGFIGNKRIVEMLFNIAGFKSPPNVLFSGPRSSGKTELARRYSRCLGFDFVVLDKLSLQPKRFAEILDAAAEQQTLFFIDEIQSLSPQTQEFLLTATEPNDKSITIKGIRYDLKKHSFVAATTNKGKLSDAFISRFAVLELQEYSEEEIAEILISKLPECNQIFTFSFLKEIAKYSKLVPRSAIIVCEYCLKLVESNPNLNEFELAEEARKWFDCDRNGLTKQDKHYLEIVELLQPVSASSLCAMMSVDKETLESSIEPFLLKNKLIKRTNRGRCLYGF